MLFSIIKILILQHIEIHREYIFWTCVLCRDEWSGKQQTSLWLDWTVCLHTSLHNSVDDHSVQKLTIYHFNSRGRYFISSQHHVMTVFMQMPCHSQWQIKRSSLQPPAVSLPQCIDCCHILMTPKHQKYFAASDVSCSFLATFASDMPHRAKSWMPSQCVQYFATVCSEVLFNLGLLVKRRMFFFCSQKK